MDTVLCTKHKETEICHLKLCVCVGGYLSTSAEFRIHCLTLSLKRCAQARKSSFHWSCGVITSESLLGQLPGLSLAQSLIQYVYFYLKLYGVINENNWRHMQKFRKIKI